VRPQNPRSRIRSANRAANHIYFAREENVRRKAADAAIALHISSRNLIPNQKTKIVSSALDICSRNERREVGPQGDLRRSNFGKSHFKNCGG
jgi:hypothetical protein